MAIQMTLTRPAAKNGGDRYEADLNGEAKPWVVYVPQSLSRVNGTPKDSITVTIE